MTIGKILALTLTLLAICLAVLLYSGPAIVYDICTSTAAEIGQLSGQNVAAQCYYDWPTYPSIFIGVVVGAVLLFVVLVRINHRTDAVMDTVSRFFSNAAHAMESVTGGVSRVVVVVFVLAFIVSSIVNTVHYSRNLFLLAEAEDFLAAIPPQQATAEEYAAAQVVFDESDMAPRMTFPGEFEWWLGREFAIIAVLGIALYLIARRKTIAIR